MISLTSQATYELLGFKCSLYVYMLVMFLGSHTTRGINKRHPGQSPVVQWRSQIDGRIMEAEPVMCSALLLLARRGPTERRSLTTESSERLICCWTTGFSRVVDAETQTQTLREFAYENIRYALLLECH